MPMQEIVQVQLPHEPDDYHAQRVQAIQRLALPHSLFTQTVINDPDPTNAAVPYCSQSMTVAPDEPQLLLLLHKAALTHTFDSARSALSPTDFQFLLNDLLHDLLHTTPSQGES